MSLKVYKFEPGQCTFEMHDPGGAAINVEVRKVSGLDAVLDPACALRENQYIYGALKLREGPSAALSALVVTASAGGTLVQWCHARPRDADKLGALLQRHLEPQPAATPQAAEAATPTAPPATGEPSTVAPAAAASPEAAARPEDAPRAAPPPPPAATAPPAPETPAASPAARDGERAAARRPRRGARAQRPLAPAAAPVQDKEADATDVAAKIRKKARVVRASDLASRLETVQVLSTAMIRGLIKEAVEEATALLGSSLQDAERKRLLEETEAGFAERLEVFKAEKAGLEQQSKALEAQLQKAQALLEEERARVVSANQFTVSDAGILELEHRMGRLLDHAVKVGGVGPEIERDMREVVARLLDDEREKIRAQAQEAQNDRIALLEKKVGRLAGSLEQAETERDRAQRRAHALEASGGLGLRNVYDVGLDDDDPSREKKLSLLKQIYEFNQEVRRRLEEEGRMPTRARAQAPAAAPPPPADPAAPSAPPAASVAEEAPAPQEGDATAADSSRESDGEDGDGDERVPVLATGGDTDPDDLPWEPGPDAVPAAARGSVRKLSRE